MLLNPLYSLAVRQGEPYAEEFLKCILYYRIDLYSITGLGNMTILLIIDDIRQVTQGRLVPGRAASTRLHTRAR